MARAFAALFARECRLAWRARARLLQPLAFAALATLLLALGMGPEPALLAAAAPSLLWVVALLAAFLASSGLFRAEYEDGGLELWRTCGLPLAWLLLAKLAAHALLVSAPLALASPLLAAWLGLPAAGIGTLLASLALGLPVLCWVGALAAALTLGLPRGGLLLALVALPLYVPVLVFGSASVHAALAGLPTAGPLTLLAALALLALCLAPPAAAAALRAGQD